MKQYFIFALIILMFGFQFCKSERKQKDGIGTEIIHNPVTASGDTDIKEIPEITFDKTDHDFGLLIEGESVEYSFHFTNTGGKDLVITKVSASCGCTVPTYKREPVKPGEKGEITVMFNSEGRYGMQTKEIKVLSNAQPSINELTITSNVRRP